MASPTINTLTSFSGADLVATFANKVIGELQQISWAVQRDKAPVFTLGSSDPRSISRGKRGIAGSMVFAVFDHDSLVAALQSVWDQIAPKAMFTASANLLKSTSEDFQNALDMVKWNNKVSESALAEAGQTQGLGTVISVDNGTRAGYGFSYDRNISEYSSKIGAQRMEGSDGGPRVIGEDGLVKEWNKGGEVYVPAGFSPIRGENIVYADTLPPFDVTLTFASEYGHTAFQKIYDVDILNESSGASVDTVVMARQVTWIARRLSPLIKGVYTRDENGTISGVSPSSAK